MKTNFAAFILLLSQMALSFQLQLDHLDNYDFPPTRNEAIVKPEEVSQIVALLDETYRPLVAAKNINLVWDLKMDNGAIGAGSTSYDGNFTIVLFGGLTRTPQMSAAAVATILCHEMGHFLGGAPHQYFDNKEDWSSSEGQADTFAASICLPKIFKLARERKLDFLFSPTDSFAIKNCQGSDSTAITSCQSVTTAAIEFTELGQMYFSPAETKVSPLKSAPERPEVTLFTAYPTWQCRMDIYLQAAQCLAHSQSCSRSACWYHESK